MRLDKNAYLAQGHLFHAIGNGRIVKLLILTQYYPPEMGAPQARLYELAKRLRDKGHAITVLTAMPNYPTGKVFDGYRWKPRRTESMDGIRVIRTCIWPSKSSRTLPRLLSYLSFVLSSVLLGVWGLGRQDVVLFESPPLFIVPAGLLIGKLTRGRIVMNVSDIWPDIIVRMGHTTGGLALKMMFWLEKYGYEHSDVVALTNPGAAAQVKERFPHVRTTVISNGVDTRFFRPDLRSDEIRASLGAGFRRFPGRVLRLAWAGRAWRWSSAPPVFCGIGPASRLSWWATGRRRITWWLWPGPRTCPT